VSGESFAQAGGVINLSVPNIDDSSGNVDDNLPKKSRWGK
jgi:hypothetical protein